MVVKESFNVENMLLFDCCEERTTTRSVRMGQTLFLFWTHNKARGIRQEVLGSTLARLLLKMESPECGRPALTCSGVTGRRLLIRDQGSSHSCD